MPFVTKKDITIARTNIDRYLRRKCMELAFSDQSWQKVVERYKDTPVGIVLAYHRVNRLPKSGFRPTRDLAVHTSEFEDQLRFLKRYFKVVPLETVVNCLQDHRELPIRFAAITFDDGYQDNFTDAYPLLLKYELPATIFLTAGLIGSNAPLWHDLLEILLHQTNCRDLSIELGIKKNQFKLRSVGERWYAYEKLSEWILQLPACQIDGFLCRVAKTLGVSLTPQMSESYRLLTWDQVRDMKASGLVAIGSHTMNHRIGTKLDESNRDCELIESREILMRETGDTITLFSYPNGTFDRKTACFLKENGYIGACTTEPKLVNQHFTPFTIPRIGAAGLSTKCFVMRIVSHMKDSAQLRIP